MDRIPKDIELKDVMGFNPSEFSRCRVSYQGAIHTANYAEIGWDIAPGQAVILSDISHIIPDLPKGRELTIAEINIMASCPQELYVCEKGIPKRFYASEVARNAKYSLEKQ